MLIFECPAPVHQDGGRWRRLPVTTYTLKDEISKWYSILQRGNVMMLCFLCLIGSSIGKDI